MPQRLTVSPLYLRPWRARVACTLAFGLCAVVGCGDTAADPIVRAADTPSGGGGGGGGGGNDGGAGRSSGNTGDLCAPCGSRFDCNDSESCVQLSRGSSHFCSHACGNGNGRCPSGYLCTDVYNVSSMQCVPEPGDCDQVVH